VGPSSFFRLLAYSGVWFYHLSRYINTGTSVLKPHSIFELSKPSLFIMYKLLVSYNIKFKNNYYCYLFNFLFSVSLRFGRLDRLRLRQGGSPGSGSRWVLLPYLWLRKNYIEIFVVNFNIYLRVFSPFK